MTTAKTTKSSAIPAAASATPAADAVKQIEEAVAVHKETIESVVKAGADVAAKGVDKAVSMSKEQVDAAVKAGTAAFKGYEDVLQFSKANVDAFVQSSTILARGVQELSKELVALAQEQIEENVSVSKALMGAKTLKEVIDLSSTVAKSSFDKLVVESTKINQLTTKLAEEAMAPLNGRVEAAMQKITETAA